MVFGSALDSEMYVLGPRPQAGRPPGLTGIGVPMCGLLFPKDRALQTLAPRPLEDCAGPL